MSALSWVWLDVAGRVPGPQDYSFREELVPSGLAVFVGSQGEIVEERDYDADFIHSRVEDHFQVVTKAGRTFDHRLWKGNECDSFVPEDS